MYILCTVIDKSMCKLVNMAHNNAAFRYALLDVHFLRLMYDGHSLVVIRTKHCG